ncbi:MAG TPA: hypothetical protein VMU35_05585 [Methylomirabilota bacterium]|nr:hypothetical protein [Methylomirabilota bacterium]
MPRIPLIDDLTKDPIPPGSNILVEFDPASQWYNASLSIAGGWLKDGGIVEYGTSVQSVAKIRSKMRRFDLDVDALERDGKLELWDWYTVTLGRKSDEKLSIDSMKVADLSIKWATGFPFTRVSELPEQSERLGIRDNASTLARFNDEKAWVEFEVTRIIPVWAAHKSVGFRGVVKGVHSEWVYKRLEDAYDGIVDFKLEEIGEETRDLIRIRSMRDIGFDRKWHRLKVGENFEITFEN